MVELKSDMVESIVCWSKLGITYDDGSFTRIQSRLWCSATGFPDLSMHLRDVVFARDERCDYNQRKPSPRRLARDHLFRVEFAKIAMEHSNVGLADSTRVRSVRSVLPVHTGDSVPAVSSANRLDKRTCSWTNR